MSTNQLTGNHWVTAWSVTPRRLWICPVYLFVCLCAHKI